LQKREFPKWLQTRIAEGSARVYPHGTFKVRRKSFEEILQGMDLEQLEGFANKNKYGANQPPWNQEQREAILWRKMELTNKRKPR
jgi:hypothetical protein